MTLVKNVLIIILVLLLVQIYREYQQSSFIVKLEKSREEQLQALSQLPQYTLCNPEKALFDDDIKRSQRGDFGPDLLTEEQIKNAEGNH